MPISLVSLSLVDSPVTLEEGRKILERDDYVCRYCGLDGRASFENALVMRVDLHSVQYDQRHAGVRQFRRSEILCPGTTGRAAQNVAGEDRAPHGEIRQCLVNALVIQRFRASWSQPILDHDVLACLVPATLCHKAS